MASKSWQARRVSNPQPPVLETGALPIELLAYTHFAGRADGRETMAKDHCPLPSAFCPDQRQYYFVSLCPVCFRQNRQYLLNSRRSDDFFRFFVVL